MALRHTGALTAAELEARMAGQHWYHTYRFDSGVTVPGTWDIEPDIGHYGFPDLRGRTVLDIGAASGWFSCWFAQQGATVTAVDAGDLSKLDWFGTAADPGYLDFDPSASQVRLMSDALDLDIEVVQHTAYEVADLGRKFDIVFLGCILIHLRDPVGALMAAREVCGDLLVATSPTVEDELPTAALYWEPRRAGLNWLVPNAHSYPLWFEAAGFSEVDTSTRAWIRAHLPTYRDSGELVNSTMTLTIAHAHP